jgi:NitT/TauT family transport system substrate-binding protein
MTFSKDGACRGRGLIVRARTRERSKITKQFGVGFLPLMVMEDQKLVEKHSKAAGCPKSKACS